MTELTELFKTLGPLLITALGIIGAWIAWKREDTKRTRDLVQATDPRFTTSVISGAFANQQQAAEQTAAIRMLADAVSALAKSNVADAIEELAKATRMSETDQVKIRQNERFLEEISRMRQAAESIARHEGRGV